MLASPGVVAIVLNWNRPDDTRRCVQSLRASDYAHLRVLVVDNGSRPDLYARLRDDLPDVEFVRSETNLGFAQGNNLGLQRALAGGAEYALVINNDTIVDSHMLSRLVAAAEACPQAGLIGPVIYYLARPSEVWFAGYRFSHNIYLLRRGLRLTPPIHPVEEVDFVSGCGVLIACRALQQVGLFGSEYFMYYEDLDLCFRVKAAGMKILCVTGASMWHAVSASTGGPDSPVKQYYQMKSSILFYRQYSKGPKLWLNILLRFLHAFASLANAVIHGRLKVNAVKMFLRGMLEGFLHRSHGDGSSS